MAEEKCEALQQEVDALKEKVEELTLDLEIVRGEKEEGGQGEGVSSVEFVQLEKHNERLKEALVKLRDVTTEEKQDLTKKLKEAEKMAAEVPSLSAKLEKFKTEVPLSPSFPNISVFILMLVIISSAKNMRSRSKP